jgi:hypothetical protein
MPTEKLLSHFTVNKENVINPNRLVLKVLYEAFKLFGSFIEVAGSLMLEKG